MLEVDSNNQDVNDGRGYIPEVKSAIDAGIEGMGGAAGEDSGTEIAENGNEASGLASVELISKTKTKTNKKPRKIFILRFLLCMSTINKTWDFF